MWPAVGAMLRLVYDQPGAASVHVRFDPLLDCVEKKLPDVHAHLGASRADILAFTPSPNEALRLLRFGAWALAVAAAMNGHDVTAMCGPKGMHDSNRSPSASGRFRWSGAGCAQPAVPASSTSPAAAGRYMGIDGSIYPRSVVFARISSRSSCDAVGFPNTGTPINSL